MQPKNCTPGPWKTDGHMIDAYDPDGERITVASTNSTWHRIGNQEDNARLIAATPDLFEALDTLHNAVKDIEGIKGCNELKMAVAALMAASGHWTP